MEHLASSILHPSRWSVRARSTVASTLVIAFCLVIAGLALVFVLANSLHLSALNSSEARATQLVQQLNGKNPADLDPSLLSTDSQIGIVQIVDADHRIVAQSPGTDSDLLSERFLGPDESDALGRVKKSDDEDYWLIGRGAQTPTGPVTVFVGADREPVETVVTTVAVLLAIVGPLVLGLAAFATYRLVGSALAPVERIRARVASISSGRQGERVPVPSGNDEIARLATTMNDMLARLDEGALAQQRFVSDASHELRSPLSTITTALELAHRRPDLLDDALIEDALLPEARRMRQLIEDLLILARSDESELEKFGIVVDVDLDDILFAEQKRIDGISEVTVAAAVAPVRLRRPESIDADGAKPRGQCSAACGDPRVSRVLRSRKRSPHRDRGRRARNPCSRTRTNLRTLRPPGPAAVEAGSGSGLGLAIASEIVAAHHGTISVSERAGGGSRFEVTIPVPND